MFQIFYRLLCCLLSENDEIFSFFIKKLLWSLSSLLDRLSNYFYEIFVFIILPNFSSSGTKNPKPELSPILFIFCYESF